MLEFSLKKIRYLNIGILVLIVLSTLLLIRFIVDISFSKKKPFVTFAEELSARKKAKGKNLMEYAGVLQNNPFGRPMQLQPIGGTEKNDTGTSKAAPISDLKLVGTVVGPNYLSYAVFQDKTRTGQEDIFHYGEKVYDYGILNKIERSSVEIIQGERSFSLTIDFDRTSNTPQISSVKRRTSRKSTSRNSFAKQIGEREYLLDRDMVQKSIENPEKVLTDARLLPNIIDGKQEGFKISEVVPDGLYHSLGLRNGDILLNINGLEIANPEVAIQAMSALKGMNRIDLDIMRNGERMSIDYQMR
jgi:general secretion pathway protein C